MPLRLTPEDLANPDRVDDITRLMAQDAAGVDRREQLPSSVKVDGQVAVFVALQNALPPLVPVERTLEQIVKCVQGIIPTFDAFV